LRLLLLLLLLEELLLLLLLVLLELLELFELGDEAGGLGVSVLGLSLRGLSGTGFRSSCALETVEANAPNKSAAANVKLGLSFLRFEFIWSPPDRLLQQLCAEDVAGKKGRVDLSGL